MFDQHRTYGFVPSPFDYSFLDSSQGAVKQPPSPAATAGPSMPADVATDLSAASSSVGPSAGAPPAGHDDDGALTDLGFDLDLDLGFGSGTALFVESWRALDPFPIAQHDRPLDDPSADLSGHLPQHHAGASYPSSPTMSPFVDKAAPSAVDQLDGFASWLQSFEPYGSVISDLPLILSSSTISGSAASPCDISWADNSGGRLAELAASSLAESAVRIQTEHPLLDCQSHLALPTPAVVFDSEVELSPLWPGMASTMVEPPSTSVEAMVVPIVALLTPEPDDASLEKPSPPRKMARKRSAPSTGVELETEIAGSASIAPPTARPAAKKAKAVPTARPKSRPKAVAARTKVSFDESTTGGSEDDDEDDDENDDDEPESKGGKADKSKLSKKERRKATNRASAAAFRNRRKNLVVDLQKQIDERAEEIRRLTVSVQDLRSKNQALKATKDTINSF